MDFKKLTVNTFVFTVFTFVQKSISFIAIPFYANYLLPDQLGLVATITSMGAVLKTCCNMSLNATVIRFYYWKDLEYRKNLFGTLLSVFIILATLTTLFSAIFSSGLSEIAFKTSKYQALILISLIGVFFDPFFDQ